MRMLSELKARAVEAVYRTVCSAARGCRNRVGPETSPATLGLPIGSDIAILVPHPDDEVVGCFHFIETYGRYFGIDLHFVTDVDDSRTAECRRAESLAATDSLPVRSRELWQFPDHRLDEYDVALDKKLKGIVGQYALVLSPAPSDGTPDHRWLAQSASRTIPDDSLLWYRSTWLTFPLSAADIVCIGDWKRKRAALANFVSQRHLALQNVISVSRMEAGNAGFGDVSIEAFRFASSGASGSVPRNLLSVRELPYFMRSQ